MAVAALMDHSYAAHGPVFARAVDVLPQWFTPPAEEPEPGELAQAQREAREEAAQDAAAAELLRSGSSPRSGRAWPLGGSGRVRWQPRQRRTPGSAGREWSSSAYSRRHGATWGSSAAAANLLAVLRFCQEIDWWR